MEERTEDITLEIILEERGKQYGGYSSAAEFRMFTMNQMNNLHTSCHGKGIPRLMKVMMSDVIHKLARVAVAPSHVDSWRDMQGYCQLIIDLLEEK